jgi:hypothetical protein
MEFTGAYVTVTISCYFLELQFSSTRVIFLILCYNPTKQLSAMITAGNELIANQYHR